MSAVNAVLVTISGAFILTGMAAIRRGDRQRHRRLMATAIVLLAVFLVLYVSRFLVFGITPFPGPGWAKKVYYPVMISHVLLATVSTPMVLAAVMQARRRRLERHCGLGRSAFPLWVYVAATGPLVYLMLYHWF